MLYKSASTFALLLLLCFASCDLIKRTRTLSIKVAVINDFGGAKPDTYAKFYLLNKDFDEILDERKRVTYSYHGVLNIPHPRGPVDHFAPPRVVRDPKSGELYVFSAEEVGELFNPDGLVEGGFKQYIVSTTTIDSEGNRKFKNVPSGKYFLVGFTALRENSNFVLWNVPVEVKVDNQTVLLSTANGFVGRYSYRTKSQLQRDRERKP